MKLFMLYITSGFLLVSASLAAAESPDFQAETKRVTSALNCTQPKITPASLGLGALYGCITGSAETVKFFINEEEGTGNIQNVKLMWNDWFVDIGYGIHTDLEEAHIFVKTFAQLYAPKLGSKLTTAFFSNSNAIFDTDNYHIEYKYHRGPKIDERLLTATPKVVRAAKEQAIKSSVSDFNACKTAVSKAVDYSELSLSGDGDPVKEEGYMSFFIGGKNKDQFFCEVHPGGRYKIKAALNSKYPFKYRAEGTF